MRLDEEEVLIRDDSGLLLDTGEVRIPKSQAWTRKLTRTMCLSLGFLVLGLCVAIPGPTLLDLEDQLKATTSQMMIVFTSRSFGYLLGALLGGVLFDCFDKQLLLFCTLLISSVATIVIPWSLTLVVMATMFALQGITMGVLDTGGNVYCIQLWGKKNGPFIQTLHFAFGIGAFVAPLLARPFLSQGVYLHNSTEIVQGNIPVAPFLHQHHVQAHDNLTKRSVIGNLEQLYAYHKSNPPDVDSSSGFNKLSWIMNEELSEENVASIYPMIGDISMNLHDKYKDGQSSNRRMKRHNVKSLLKKEDTSDSSAGDPLLDDMESPPEGILPSENSKSSSESLSPTDKDFNKSATITTSTVKPNVQTTNKTTDTVHEAVTVSANVGLSNTTNSVSANSSKAIDITPQKTEPSNNSTNSNGTLESTTKPPSTPISSTTVSNNDEPVKKPSAATDNNRESSSADGKPISKHLDNHKDDSVDSTKLANNDDGTLISDADSSLNKTDSTPENITNTANETETSPNNGTNANDTNHVVPTLSPGIINITPSSSDANLLNNKTLVSNVPEISSSKSDATKTSTVNGTTLLNKSSTTPHVIPPVPSPVPTSKSATAVVPPIKVKSTTKTTTTSSTTTSTTKATTTAKPVTTTKTTTTKLVTKTSSTAKPSPTKSSAVKPTTSVTKAKTTTESPALKTTESKISTKKPSSTSNSVTRPDKPQDTVNIHDDSKLEQTTISSLNASVSNDTNNYVLTTEVSKKPETTDDSFIHHAIAAVKNISRIQFAYVIIGLLLFVIAIVFLVLYCRDKGGRSVRGDFEELERFKSISTCSKNSLIILLGMFYFCYMGLEVTFGALVTTFAVEYNHWPKEQGAVVAAIFWGSLATGRGLSIFISRCCGPSLMLAIDLFLMIVGGLILAIGIPYMDVLLWLGTLILGLGMSSAFPAGITWAESRFHLTGKSTAVLVIGSAIGQMVIPVLSGYLYEVYGAMSLMYITVALTVTALLIYILMQCASLQSSGTLKINARNGFLPLEDNDDDDDDNMEMGDLVHFDKSQTRTIRDRRRGEDAMYHTLISDLEDD